jgi:hypothetical protein
MSSLWTPSGEHFPKEEGGGGGSPPGQPGDTDVTPTSPEAPLTEEQLAAQAEVDAMRAQLAHTPAEVVVANHCYGLFELAAIYLSQNPPQLFQARLAISGKPSPLSSSPCPSSAWPLSASKGSRRAPRRGPPTPATT